MSNERKISPQNFSVCTEAATWKKDFLFCQVCILWTFVDLFWMKSLFSQETVFLTQLILPQVRKGSSSLEFRYSGARNKFKTDALPRIFSYSTEHLNLPGHCKYLSVSSLWKAKKRRHFPKKQAITTSVSHENKQIFTRKPIFSRVL